MKAQYRVLGMARLFPLSCIRFPFFKCIHITLGFLPQDCYTTVLINSHTKAYLSTMNAQVHKLKKKWRLYYIRKIHHFLTY